MYYPTLTKEELRESLKSGVYEIEFEKLNGEIRHMECTLHPAFLPPLKEDYVPTRKERPDTIAVWDSEKAGWRSIIISKILKIERKRIDETDT